jgi:flagellar biosynthesis protein FlhA
MASCLQHREDGSTTLQIDPEIAHKLLGGIAKSIEQFQKTGSQPIVLCGSLIRWEFKRLIKRFIPGVAVLAFDELPQGTKTQTLGSITI